MRWAIAAFVVITAIAAAASDMAAARPLPATDTAVVGATDFSARHRAVRHPRPLRVRVYRTPPRYYARPYTYRPFGGLTPFFPFGLGYGLDPSW